MNPEIKRAMENTMIFLSSELSVCNIQKNKLHAAVLAYERIFEACDKTLSKSHPNLGYRLRVIRSQELPRKINVALKEIKNIHQEVTNLRRDKRNLMMDIKNLKKTAEGFLGANPRSSSRKLAAHNTVLQAENIIYKQKLRKP